METIKSDVLKELVRAGALLSTEIELKKLVSIIVEQSKDITRSDLSCLYLSENPDKQESSYKLIYRRGKYNVPEKIYPNSETLAFLIESREALVVLERSKKFFNDIFLNPKMNSAIALPLFTRKGNLAVLILNSLEPEFYNRTKFEFLDSFSKLASGALGNSKMVKEIKDYLKKIESLERYQENIFSSMTNLLITTDSEGKIKYFNKSATERLGVTENSINQRLDTVFEGKLSEIVLNTINKSIKEGKEHLGIEGIFKADEREMDFSLNLSPLKTKRGKREGLTLLFTDQTRERELQQQMAKVKEERRIIKDMFARYLSQEVVQQLVNQPNLVRPGGDKKEATIFFADIRGYTAFSEGKDPEYIIKVLNEYFSEAVELVIKHKGYIDKFIGDCIMAAWGVPLQTAEEDAIQAVSCALEIQEMVASPTRKFFRGEASNLKIGIGMHTGPLVAGNLGSSRRMNYTVIGDTVNLAARLEGVAGPGEVIITETTKRLIEGYFKVEKRKPVMVKGKSQPIQIYNVLKKAG